MIPESTTFQIKTPQSSPRISILTISIDSLKYTVKSDPFIMHKLVFDMISYRTIIIIYYYRSNIQIQMQSLIWHFFLSEHRIKAGNFSPQRYIILLSDFCYSGGGNKFYLKIEYGNI